MRGSFYEPVYNFFIYLTENTVRTNNLINLCPQSREYMRKLGGDNPAAKHHKTLRELFQTHNRVVCMNLW